jgi:hypothetical protein
VRSRRGRPSKLRRDAGCDRRGRRVRLVFYAFDLLHIDGRDRTRLPLLERKALLEPILAEKPGLQFNGHETGDGELIRRHAFQLGYEGVVSKTVDAPYAPGQPRLVAQGKMSKPPGIRRRRMDRPRGVTATSRRAVAGLL